MSTYFLIGLNWLNEWVQMKIDVNLAKWIGTNENRC